MRDSEYLAGQFNNISYACSLNIILTTVKYVQHGRPYCFAVMKLPQAIYFPHSLRSGNFTFQYRRDFHFIWDIKYNSGSKCRSPTGISLHYRAGGLDALGLAIKWNSLVCHLLFDPELQVRKYVFFTVPFWQKKCTELLEIHTELHKWWNIFLELTKQY